ncbi:MAG TPA: hypothetical protein DHW82_09700 [Spirochaetia bacterium]|nr:MAG: hypothetical protein A2Y41_00460 [Spirochaetes bacterium GWB1_36_13]HCL57265.1 hypothetical protein [Spirochaetia bacterium]
MTAVIIIIIIFIIIGVIGYFAEMFKNAFSIQKIKKYRKTKKAETTWKNNLQENHPEHFEMLKKDRIKSLQFHYNKAKYYENINDFDMARGSYRKAVEAARQNNILNDYIFEDLYKKVENDYFEFALKKDPLFNEILRKITPTIKATPGILQSDLFKYFKEIQKEEIQYSLYIAEKSNLVKRIKKGRSYILSIPD